MAVFRVERTRDYTVMCNHHLKDSNLSLKAKGLLSMILSLPDEWNYTTRGLAAICKEGVDAIGKTLKELELAGYIIRRQLRGKDGRISDTEYTIFEKPRKPSPPDTTLPDTENPYLDKDIHDAFAIRILLESYAISNINPEALEQERGEIEALIARCTSGNRRDEKELDVLVHETAIRLCQNAALLDIYRTLYTKIGLFRDISIADKKMSDLANRSHAVMLRSILDGNTSKALHIVKKHLQESEEKVISYYRGSRKEGA